MGQRKNRCLTSGKTALLLFFVAFNCSLVLFLAACSAGGQKPSARDGFRDPDNRQPATSMKVLQKTTFSHIDIRTDRRGNIWIPLRKAAESLDFRVKWNGKTFAMGYTDPLYVVKMDEVKGRAEDMEIVLPDPPKLMNNEPYMTTRALSQLWGTRIKFDATNRIVILRPIDDTHLNASGQQMLREDKYGMPREIREPGTVSRNPERDNSGRRPTGDAPLPAVDTAKLIQFARSFYGAKYEFGAKPYFQSGTFDCSSFVQHVFGQFGVSLPRSSRSQAEMGRLVNVQDLQPGDLLFFYVPNRFKSNRIVGHVAIYAGDGKMVHTYGKKGVTESEFSQWEDRFLLARRIVETSRQ